MTGAELMILGKLALTFGVLLGVPLWQLRSVRRILRAAADTPLDAVDRRD